MDNLKHLLIDRFPNLYTEGMSTYEILSKIVYYINQCVDGVNTINDKFYEFIHWFDNLDISDQVDDKLEEMATDGTLSTIINQQLFTDIRNSITALTTTVTNNNNAITKKVEGIYLVLDVVTGEDITNKLQQAIYNIEIATGSEEVTSTLVKNVIKIPSGSFIVSRPITIKANISIEGSGKHITVLNYTKEDGSYCFRIGFQTFQCFHNTLKGFTIDGGYKANGGIEMKNVSRWVMSDISIEKTKRFGISLNQCWVGEMYSVLTRGCGSADHYSMVLTGSEANYGCHAVTMIGCELSGGGTEIPIKGGIFIEHGMSIALYNVTIQAYMTGIALYDCGVANKFDNLYLEENLVNIRVKTQDCIISNPFIALLPDASTSAIQIESATHCQFINVNVKSSKKIFGTFGTNPTMTMCRITAPSGFATFTIEAPLNHISNVIEYWDNNTHTRFNGNLRFNNDIRYDLGVTLPKATFTGVEASTVPNGTIFVDVSSGLLKYKDGTGTVKNITMA